MKNRIKRLSWTAIAVFSLAFLFTEIVLPQKSQETIRMLVTAVPNGIGDDRSREEKIIRFAYKKLELYNVVARFGEGKGLPTAGRGDTALTFSLSDFATGSIDDLRNVLYDEASSPPTGDMIQIVRSAVKMNDTPERLRYFAKWIPGLYSRMADRNWTVGDILKLEVDKYYDVRKFTSYKVNVVFEGKTRNYNAMVLYHGDPENLKLEFWDGVVGMGGAMTKVWEEELPPEGLAVGELVDAKENTFQKRVERVIAFKADGQLESEAALNCDKGARLIQQCQVSRQLLKFWGIDNRDYWLPDFGPSGSAETGGSPETNSSELTDVFWHPSDETGHIPGTGAHYGFAQFRPECSIVSSTTQRCQVGILVPQFGDTESNHNDSRYHVGTITQQSRGQTGPRGQNIQCDAAVGVAFSRCFFRNCVVPIELAIISSGISAVAHVTGGDLWRAGHAEGNICNLPLPTGGSPGGCNQSAEYGCMQGFIAVGGLCTRSDAFMTQCFRFGDYDFDSCACTGGCEGACSPIVVDILGNGFKMSNASTGVFFDMEGQGTAGQFSWTAENSDDAWLALDRNNNGLIDSGKELFGNITAQDIHAEGVERNGFLALALYDSAAYGGNGDGFITRHDAIFSRLRLWRDDNHNGVSEACELSTLPELGLEEIDLRYRSSRRVDEHGNEFKYRSRVSGSRDSNIGRWAWDVFLVRQP